MTWTEVPRPQVLRVTRAAPGRASIGDNAVARLDVGLRAFLETVAPEGTDVAGFVPGITLPIGLASTAAIAIVEPLAPAGVAWAGREVDVQVAGELGVSDIAEARAELVELSAASAWFAIDVRTAGGNLLVAGRLRLIALSDGTPASYPTAESLAAVRQKLAAASRPEIPRVGQLSVSVAPSSIRLGGKGWLEVAVAGRGADDIVTVSAGLPFGAGLTIEGARHVTVAVPATGVAHVAFVVCADRPDTVNLGRPWDLVIRAGPDRVVVPIRVPDPDPGRIYYVLTEDCETFDGGPATGDYAAIADCGNHNNFMDPEDYRVQMIRKADRLNEIAERHGACWTHFVAVTQRFAIDWAISRSSTGEWPRVAAELDASIRRGSIRHEYAPHMHFDYDPESKADPQPRLVYDAATDGILPNEYWDATSNPTHRYHDWDGAARGHVYLRELGQLDVLDTKAGSLRKSLRYLARLQANRRGVLGSRTGSFDFGGTPHDQAVSTRAYLLNGLRGNSDAYMTSSPCPPGGQMFWCRETERTLPIDALADAQLLQLAVTHDTVFDSADVLNRWFGSSIQACTGPGVHTLMVMTHAMFMRGAPDPFRSLDGGSFAELDAHLAWVRAQYPGVRFATFTEALLESLDYGSPTLETWTEPAVSGGEPGAGIFECPVRLLGRGIRVASEYPAEIAVRAPALFDGSDIETLTLLMDGHVLVEATGFSNAELPSVRARIESRGTLTLRVRTKPHAIESVQQWFADGDGVVRFVDRHEAVGRSLLQCRSPKPGALPGEIVVAPDVLRLLMNPLAGHAEPIGRRVHPLGGFPIGAAITGVRSAKPDASISSVKLRWVTWPDVDAELVVSSATSTEQSGQWNTTVRDASGRVVAMATVGVGT